MVVPLHGVKVCDNWVELMKILINFNTEGRHHSTLVQCDTIKNDTAGTIYIMM